MKRNEETWRYMKRNKENSENFALPTDKRTHPLTEMRGRIEKEQPSEDLHENHVLRWGMDSVEA